jgi:hypothetical protein
LFLSQGWDRTNLHVFLSGAGEKSLSNPIVLYPHP